MKHKIDWIVHVHRNFAQCAECGEIIEDFAPNMCNVHTFGLQELYNHLDFQIVLDIGDKTSGCILNSLGLRVQAGEKFYAGQVLDDVIMDYKVKLIKAEDDGREVLRVVLPDINHKFPQDLGCAAFFNLQELPTKELMVQKKPELLN